MAAKIHRSSEMRIARANAEEKNKQYAGEDAGYITGQVFGVNGGLVI